MLEIPKDILLFQIEVVLKLEDNPVIIDNVLPCYTKQFIEYDRGNLNFNPRNNIESFAGKLDKWTKMFNDNSDTIGTVPTVDAQIKAGLDGWNKTISYFNHRCAGRDPQLDQAIVDYSIAYSSAYKSLTVWSPDDEDRYNHILNLVETARDKYSLKKRFHKDDNLADEKLVALACYFQDSMVISDDSDVCNMTDAMNQDHGFNVEVRTTGNVIFSQYRENKLVFREGLPYYLSDECLDLYFGNYCPE